MAKKVIFLLLCITLVIAGYVYVTQNRYFTITTEQEEYSIEDNNEELDININIENLTFYNISSDENYFLSYRIYSNNDKIFEGERISVNIEQHKSQDYVVPIDVPEIKGDYICKIDIVKEGEYWTEDLGDKPLEISITTK